MADGDAKPTELSKKFKAMSMLPDGSELKGVMLPRYDKNRKLVGVLKAGTMTLLNAEEIAGTVVSIEFFNPDQSPRGRMDLKKASFNQEKNLLVAKEPVTIQSQRMTATGEGLFYSVAEGKAFLSGKVVTIMKPQAPPP